MMYSDRIPFPFKRDDFSWLINFMKGAHAIGSIFVILVLAKLVFGVYPTYQFQGYCYFPHTSRATNNSTRSESFFFQFIS